MREAGNKPWYYLGLPLIAVLAIAFAVIMFFVPDEAGNSNFALGTIVVTALIFIYGILSKQLTPKVEGKTEHGNPYHNFFFRGTAVLTMVLTLLGIIGAFFVYVEHHNLFQAVGLVTAIIWIGAFLMYFMWAVYHYNINYGLTDKDWEKIFRAEQRFKQGLPVLESELEAPKSNPYRSQTFGLPPGTIRGMIALTLLIGGMSLLIVSFGTEYTGAELALVRQQFEFFETAFLMMIAFYFGDKSLRYLKDRWVDPNRRTAGSSNGDTPNPPGGEPNGGGPNGDRPDRPDVPGIQDSPDEPRDQVAAENRQLAKEEFEFAKTHDTPVPAPGQKSTSSAFLSLPNAISIPREVEYVQIMDNLHQKVLSDEAIKDALEELKSKDNIDLSLPVVKAIIAVESAGRGHLPDGKAKILFEGHKFWRWLDKFNLDPEKLQLGNEKIIYKNWTKEHYLKGSLEYQRLEAAKKIHEKAAIYATSWGLFQILGENLDDNIKGRNYQDHREFEQKQHESEYYHLLDFLEFIKTKKVRGKALIQYVSEENPGNYDWETFAYGYNGSGYKVNQYDTKLRTAYLQFKKEEPGAVTGWIPIIDAGHGGIIDGKYATAGKQYHFNDGTTIYEGVVNRAIGRLLAKKLDAARIPYFHTNLDDEADLGLMERVQIANTLFRTNRSCYLLSIHSNAASNDLEGEGSRATGFEIFTSIGLTKSDELANVASKWYKKLFPDFPFREVRTSGGEYANKEADYVVLAKTQGPAFLVENLFYDNLKEAKFLLSAEGQERIAECLFQIVREIHKQVSV